MSRFSLSIDHDGVISGKHATRIGEGDPDMEPREIKIAT